MDSVFTLAVFFSACEADFCRAALGSIVGIFALDVFKGIGEADLSCSLIYDLVLVTESYWSGGGSAGEDERVNLRPRMSPTSAAEVVTADLLVVQDFC